MNRYIVSITYEIKAYDFDDAESMAERITEKNLQQFETVISTEVDNIYDEEGGSAW